MDPTLLTDPRLRGYLEDVRLWHGYVRFLGLPTLQDRPDTPLTDLFVPPQLSPQRVAPETDPQRWPAGQDVLSALQQRRRLVVLGDPGSGKSTIVNWLAWLLAGGDATALPGVLPVPLVARELKLGPLRGFDDLLAAFMARPVAEALRSQPEVLREHLDRGNVLLLLDGLDEVAFDQREALRAAVREGWTRHPNMLMLATSRIVGYDACPLDPVVTPRLTHNNPQVEQALAQAGADETGRLLALITDLAYSTAAGRTPVLYVMPFDDARIHAFAQQWYRLRSIKQVAQADAASFTRALLAEPGVSQLARTPQLLTLMALVYRVRAQLPDGRALLYDMITEAYLESIDTSRALAIDPYPWREKRRWLARVGFEMQVLRSELAATDTAATGGAGRELLASKQQVVQWLTQAMAQSGYTTTDASFVDDYLDWVARRSGLLLPRGEDLFAFVHLSFQEYFAALYLQEHLADADWVIAQREGSTYADGDVRVNAPALAAWAADALWQETLVFAQECFAHSPRDARRLVGWMFGDGYRSFLDRLTRHPTEARTTDDAAAAALLDDTLALGELLARLVADPHSGLAQADREQAMHAQMVFYERAELRFEAGRGFRKRSGALKRVMASELAAPMFWAAIVARRPQALSLMDAGDVDGNALHPLDFVTHFYVDRITAGAVSGIAHLKQARVLWIRYGSNVSSLDPFASMAGLEELLIGNLPAIDLSPLARLQNLRALYTLDGAFTDVTPLGTLPQLTKLSIDGAPVQSLAALSDCRQLEWLDIANVPASDLTALDLLPLQTLYVSPRHLLTDALKAREAAGLLTVVRQDDVAAGGR